MTYLNFFHEALVIWAILIITIESFLCQTYELYCDYWLLFIDFDFDSLRIHFLCFNCVHQNKTTVGFSLVAPFHFSRVFRQFKVLDSHRQSIFLFCLTSITLKIIIWVFWTVLIWGVSVNVITKLYICVLDSSWNLLNIEKLWQIHANLTKRQSHENGLGNGDLQVVEVWYFVGWRQNTKPVKKSCNL